MGGHIVSRIIIQKQQSEKDKRFISKQKYVISCYDSYFVFTLNIQNNNN